jgi:hypothetical protein
MRHVYMPRLITYVAIHHRIVVDGDDIDCNTRKHKTRKGWL